MIKRLFWDERGDLSFFTIFVILSINMVMAFLLLFATIRIECINIRNAAKMELNNVSARIYADTCLLYTSPSPRDRSVSRMPSSA